MSSLPNLRPILAAMAVLAAVTSQARAQTADDLSTIEQQIDASKSLQEQMTAERQAIVEEQAALSQKLIALAEKIQSREAAILSAEERLGELDAEQLRIHSSLAARREEISRLLAGLQRIERNPPPALVVEPTDVLSALRSAMMFGTIVPELRQDAAALSAQLARLETLKVQTKAEQERLRDHVARLLASRREMTDLQARKKSLLADTTERLKAEKQRARELADKAKDMKQLLSQLEEERLKAEAAEKARAEAEARTAAELKAKAEAQARIEAAKKLQPRMAFADIRASLQYPAQGQILKAYGVNDGFGGTTRGVFVATRADAQVVTPVDGHVEFAGPFRSYGQLLILNTGGGYHVLLAGLGEITAEQGQFLQAGEPVGIMGKSAAPGTLTGDQLQDGRPVLYIEFRKNGEAIDSSPWWIGGFAQARG
ncbi:murein hydrolase activator EnvC family protein [Taklimakanibacter lacteus]|uniref:murein hydrolase activator EnvC family protein n=1 Tax=Taklimakanibacter lacteus TaxID=2268456 RepID=UPI000E663BE1